MISDLDLMSVNKPSCYTGGEKNSVIKDKDKVSVRFAFCFPDTYEIGMSHLGMKILYSMLNEDPDTWCERVFAPASDMEDLMRSKNIPLFGLESGDAIKDFDFLGFTLMYELCYTNVLNMLDLAGIPVESSERSGNCPVVIAGGACTSNPEPMADFFDIMIMGEGEEVLPELMQLYKKCKAAGMDRPEFLEQACHIEGIYVPAFYKTQYNDDGTIKSFAPENSAPAVVKKRIVKDLNTAFYPETFVVPFVQTVHDRAITEIFRGCSRGCRFCQAGYLYRPVREKSADVCNAQSKALCASTGYDEVSLLSLSTSDHSQIIPMLSEMTPWTEEKKINIALPSLRIDNFPQEIAEKLKLVRKSSLTFAPEAGSQRLRDAINKNITEDDIFGTVDTAFADGWDRVKLYFMIGLPTETDEDVLAIASLAQKVVDHFYANPSRRKGSGVTVTVSCATFVPKPFTPFQWEAQCTREQTAHKQQLLLSALKSRKIHVTFHDPDTSFLEAVTARGDRRLGRVIKTAWQNGAKFDSWDDSFNIKIWNDAFTACGTDPSFYACRERENSEVLPWDFIDAGVNRSFFELERKRSKENTTTCNCREKCAGCGARQFAGGVCDAYDTCDIQQD